MVAEPQITAEEQQSAEAITAVVGRPWKPGQSGNPKGRPKKGDTFVDHLALQVQTQRQRLAKAAVEKAINGDVRALVFIRDTLFGVPHQTLRLESEEDPFNQLLAAMESRYKQPAIDAEVKVLPESTQT